MAQPIKYRPKAQTAESAREQLDEVLRALSDSGTLRLLKDLLERIGPVSQVLAERVETEPGRNALGNLAVLGAGLTRLPPDRLQVAVQAAGRAFERAGRLARREPPSFLQMLGVLRSSSVRRALVALLTLLYATGELLQPDGLARPDLRRG